MCIQTTPYYYVHDQRTQLTWAPKPGEAPAPVRAPKSDWCFGGMIGCLAGVAVISYSTLSYVLHVEAPAVDIQEPEILVSLLVLPLFATIGCLWGRHKKYPPSQATVISHIQKHGLNAFCLVQKPDPEVKVFNVNITRASAQV